MPKSQKDGFSLKKNSGDNITSSHVNFTSFSVERCEGIEGNGEQGELDIYYTKMRRLSWKPMEASMTTN
jgi:hypothetical protein